MDQEIRKEVDAAVKQAKADPEPADVELYTHIYSQKPDNFAIRTIDPFEPHVRV